MEELLKGLAEELEGDDGEGMGGLLESMMDNLLSKEVLYPSLQDVSAKVGETAGLGSPLCVPCHLVPWDGNGRLGPLKLASLSIAPVPRHLNGPDAGLSGEEQSHTLEQRTRAL
jgi:hypothetical protein